jgi:hypothetical protein
MTAPASLVRAFGPNPASSEALSRFRRNLPEYRIRAICDFAFRSTRPAVSTSHGVDLPIAMWPARAAASWTVGGSAAWKARRIFCDQVQPIESAVSGVTVRAVSGLVVS